jgi:hypothetical protein
MSQETQSVVERQPREVQSYCLEFTQSYNKNRKTISDWGRILLAIKNGKLNPVDAKGEPFEGNDPQGLTFSAICGELGVPRSTAYHYINEYITVTTYPEPIQEAARKLNVNLALDYVRAAFIAGEYPPKPNENEAMGIVAKLKLAKPAATLSRQSPAERFREMVEEALVFAKRNKLLTEVVANSLINSLSKMDAETLAFVFETAAGAGKQQA